MLEEQDQQQPLVDEHQEEQEQEQEEEEYSNNINSLQYLEQLQKEQDEFVHLQQEASKMKYEIDVVISDDRFAKLYNQEQFSDAIFHLVHNDAYIFVTKAIIAAQSSLLQNLFMIDNVMGDSDGASRKQIVDVDEHEEAFEAMIRYMYTGKLQCMFVDLFPLLMLSRQYRVDKLNGEIIKYLAENIDEENCLNVYMFCVLQYNQNEEMEEIDEKLRKKCLSYIARRFDHVSKSQYFLEECTEDFVATFVKMDNLQVSNEGVVLEAIVNWINFALLDRLPHAKELIGLVRLHHVNIETLHRVFKENQWLREDPLFNKQINMILFQTIFTLKGQKPPQLGYDDNSSDQPPVQPSEQQQLPVRGVNKSKGVIQIFRGEVDKASGWMQTAKKVDAIDVTAKNKCMHLVGVGVNTGMKPGAFTANIQITKGLKTLLIRTYSWDGKEAECQNGYKTLTFFDKPVFMQPGETVSIGVLMKGPFTTQTKNGKDNVTVEYDSDEIKVTFSNSKKDENNTSVSKGQIPCIFIQ